MSTRTVLRLVILSVFLFLCYLSCCVDKSEGAYSKAHLMWVYRRQRRVHAGIRVRRVGGYGRRPVHKPHVTQRQWRTRRKVYKRVTVKVSRQQRKKARQQRKNRRSSTSSSRRVVYSRRYGHRVYYNRAVQPFPGSTITHRTVNTGPVLPPIYLPPILPNGCGGRCGRNAVCLGGHTCVCLPTYKGNPLTVCHPGGGPCGNRCGIRARCLTGTGKCVCNPGYYGNPLVACFPGYRCRRGCGVNAVCDRRQGLCKCRPGYIGNPHYQCVSLAGCRGGCGPNAVCNRKRHACVCVKGTGPNPVIGCKPRNGCKRHCGKNAFCDKRTFKCQCYRGFHGNANSACNPLPCEGRCGKNALCKNGACVCTTGCAGDPYTRCFYVQ